MGRPKGFTQAGIYPRDAHLRVPRAAVGAMRMAVAAWEVAEVRREVAAAKDALRQLQAKLRPSSATHAKRLAKAKAKKSRSRPGTRK